MVLVLCPGWERVQMVFSVLEETRVSESLHPDVALLGVGKDQAKNFKLPKNCKGPSICRSVDLSYHFLFIVLLSTRPYVGDNTVHNGPSAVLPLPPLPAAVPPGA